LIKKTVFDPVAEEKADAEFKALQRQWEQGPKDTHGRGNARPLT
jgi:hypothetical protein